MEQQNSYFHIVICSKKIILKYIMYSRLHSKYTIFLIYYIAYISIFLSRAY